jgi:ABC-type dipeptide/oligopeptide/nickel transport system permease component
MVLLTCLLFVLTLSVGFWLGALAAFGQKNHISYIISGQAFSGRAGKK